MHLNRFCSVFGLWLPRSAAQASARCEPGVRVVCWHCVVHEKTVISMKAFLKAQDGSFFNLAPKVTTIGREGCDLTIQVSTKWPSLVDTLGEILARCRQTCRTGSPVSVWHFRSTIILTEASSCLEMWTYFVIRGMTRWYRSVQATDWLDRQGDMTDDSAAILFKCFLQEAILGSSGMGRDVHSLMLSIQHFLCRPLCHPPSKVLRKMVL